MNPIILSGCVKSKTDYITGGIIFYVLPDLQLDDIVRLKKQHPCGSFEWQVTRLGADIRIECRGCSRRIMLSRRELARRLKTILPRDEDE